MGEVATVVGGSTPKTGEASYWGGDIPWITPDDLSGFTDKYIEGGRRSITKQGYESCSVQMVPTGTVLFTSRAPIGYMAIARNPVCTSQGFKSFVCGPDVDPEYVYWYLHVSLNLARSLASGTTFPELSGKAAARIPIPLPLLKDQRRIVGVIEERLAILDASRAALIKAQAKLDVYIRRRTEIAFAEPNGIPWPKLPLGELASVGTGSTPLRSQSEYWLGGTVPWVTSGQVNDDFVTLPAARVTDVAVAASRLKLWPRHTLLVAMYGEGRTRGKCSELLIEATINQACAAIVLNPDAPIRREFLKLFLQSRYESHRKMASGGVQPNLNLGIVRGWHIPLPPVDVQDEIAQNVAASSSVLEAVQETVKGSIIRASVLRRRVISAEISQRAAS